MNVGVPPPTKTVSLGWAVQDPSKVTGSTDQVKAAYEVAYQYTSAHINDLVEAILGDKID